MNDEAPKLRGKDGPQGKYVEKDGSLLVFWKNEGSPSHQTAYLTKIPLDSTPKVWVLVNGWWAIKGRHVGVLSCAFFFLPINQKYNII